MQFPFHITLRVAACLSAACLMTGCDLLAQHRAKIALNDYQIAEASNDLPAARKALLELVRAKDDVPDYWVQLGKVQTAMGNFNDAYYAYSRAYELDRTNVDVLRSVTEMALRSGDLPSAQSHADELSVLSPGDAWPKLVKGWAAITQTHFDQALDIANAMLASSPYDPSAIALKGRALLGLDRQDDAIELLTKQIQAQPTDVGSLQLLARIYVRRNDWQNALRIAQSLSQLTPTNPQNSLLVVQAGFRSGNVQAAREASVQLLQPNADTGLISSVLDQWANYWNSPERGKAALALAARAQRLDQKLIYAGFINQFGDPADSARLIDGAAGTPITPQNAEANAVIADAWARMGKTDLAKSRFGAVLSFDPGNATALRGRAELELRTGQKGAAVADAQKLVTVLPTSAPGRLLLARAFTAAGNNAWADRTLWAAFQDIPADEQIFAALEATKKGDPDATRDLQEEFDRQRDTKLGRGLI